MNFLPSLATWQFAAAGLLCSLVPVVLHLLRRRRQRTIPWAAMHLVRDAARRQHRAIWLRHVALLALRVLAAMLLGLALARPFLTASGQGHGSHVPLHAVLLIDNSLSMSYRSLAGTLLDQARARAEDYLARLPAGSRVTVIPLCGSESSGPPEPLADHSRILATLRSIQPVDRGLNVADVVSEARHACELLPDMPARVVLFTDQQRRNASQTQPEFGDLPSLQIVTVSPRNWSNWSVADVRVQDAVADCRTPSTILVVVRHHGNVVPEDTRNEAPEDTQLTLRVGERAVATRNIHLEAGETTHTLTFQHVFSDASSDTGQPSWVPVTATLTPDALPGDNQRQVIVPVAAGLPIVFVDQYGAENEEPLAGSLGETRNLRSLLAPMVERRVDQQADREHAERPLIDVRHVSLSQLRSELLADAHWVVLAGVRDPGDRVALLRDYVLQGGRVLIAAGGEFDADAWNESAWLEGRGILPYPLSETLVPAASNADPTAAPVFSLDVDSLLQEPLFQLPGASTEQLRDLYREPVFFQAVRVRESQAAREQLLQATRERVAAQPRSPGSVLESAAFEKERLGDETPRVLARFAVADRPPFLVERQMGKGNILFLATGLSAEWSSLPLTNAFLMFDRLLRRELRQTLPRCEFSTATRLAVPLPAAPTGAAVQLFRPGSTQPEFLDPAFLDANRRGVVIEPALERGVYRLAVASGTGGSAPQASSSERMLSVAGPADESDLAPLPREQWDDQFGDLAVDWVEAGEAVSVAGAGVRAEGLWRWLLLVVLVLLLGEMAITGWLARNLSPQRKGASRQGETSAGLEESAA